MTHYTINGHQRGNMFHTRVCSLETYVDNDGFNESSQLEQATIQVGGKRYNLNFSKITKNWSSKSIFKKRKIEAIFIGL